MYSYFSRCHVTTNSVAPPPLYKLHTTHNSLIRSDEGLTLETSIAHVHNFAASSERISAGFGSLKDFAFLQQDTAGFAGLFLNSSKQNQKNKQIACI